MHCSSSVYFLKICPKHVEDDWQNKLRINSASSWFLLHGSIITVCAIETCNDSQISYRRRRRRRRRRKKKKKKNWDSKKRNLRTVPFLVITQWVEVIFFTTTRCVITQKSTFLSYFAAEAWNHAKSYLLMYSRESLHHTRLGKVNFVLLEPD